MMNISMRRVFCCIAEGPLSPIEDSRNGVHTGTYLRYVHSIADILAQHLKEVTHPDTIKTVAIATYGDDRPINGYFVGNKLVSTVGFVEQANNEHELIWLTSELCRMYGK